MPNDTTLYKSEDIQPLKEIYQDVNKNEIKFLGKVWVIIEYNNTQMNLPLLITKTTDITPLLGVNWLKQLPITYKGISLNKETNQSEAAIHTKFKKLFKTNHTIKNTEVKIQIKPGCNPIQQKVRPIPYHLQDDVKNELDRLIKSGHLERLETIEEDCFVSPVVKRPHMPNMDEIFNQISSELSKNESDPIWISVIDLDYAYGQRDWHRKQANIATLQSRARI